MVKTITNKITDYENLSNILFLDRNVLPPPYLRNKWKNKTLNNGTYCMLFMSFNYVMK